MRAGGGCPAPCGKQLLVASGRTLDRLLAPLRVRGGGRSLTRPGTLLRQQIPIRGTVWEEDKAGWLEAVDQHFLQGGLGLGGGWPSQRNAADALGRGVGIFQRDLGIVAAIAHPQSANRVLAFVPHLLVSCWPMLTSANSRSGGDKIAFVAVAGAFNAFHQAPPAQRQIGQGSPCASTW